ncbi:hypothetical protein [Antarcticirhabdus aurantiaca]|uniref:Uncharacterized protein n=1 Tax=Antarcticirhabdus aurantiaca TaxID=2606717 RepID=A0ACD4NJB3_9HYPH|nr:hypothetical protein OXU80_18400 [Jeongeuplla avenae]
MKIIGRALRPCRFGLSQAPSNHNAERLCLIEIDGVCQIGTRSADNAPSWSFFLGSGRYDGKITVMRIVATNATAQTESLIFSKFGEQIIN